jgi:hypothetical protein
MKVKFLKVADHICRVDGRKLSLIGIYDQLHFPDFPAKFGPIHLALELEPEVHELEKPQDIEVRVTDEDGKEVFRFGWQGLTPPRRPDCRLQPFPAHLKIETIMFPSPGTYRIDVFQGDRPIFEEHLYVEKRAKSKAA